MKIKYKNAVIIWFVLAVSIIVKDIIVEQTDYLNNDPAKILDKGEYPFIVIVDPIDANVRIMNIKPKYKKGMILSKGKYDIEVSKYGYKSLRVWLEHTDDSEHIIKLKEKGLNE